MKTESDPAVIRILIVDDHAVVRIGLKTILADDRRIQVVGEAASGAECLRLVPTLKPRVILLDLRLKDISGDEICRRVKAMPEAPAVIMLTSFSDDRSVLACLDAGVDGYLLKDCNQTDLADAIARVARGGSVFDPIIIKRPGFTAGPSGITGRIGRLSRQEVRVLQLIAEGRPNKEVASMLQLSDGTVRNYLTSIFTKLEVTNRTEAVVLWLDYMRSGGLAP